MLAEETMALAPLSPIDSASTLAVIYASHEPLLCLTANLRLIAASASFCRIYNIDPATIAGQTLPDLGDGEWGSAQVASLLTATAKGSATVEMYETDLVRRDQETRHLVLNATRLEGATMQQTRVLLAITDVTAMRAEAQQKADLIREKAVLLQEFQHRIANSLQIIASVLMQSARRVQSEESRGHLRMPISASSRSPPSRSSSRCPACRTWMLHHISTSCARACQHPMISDPGQIRLTVTADRHFVSPSASISLGLIVTELVINALKHAFTGHESGEIAVTYRRKVSGWTLSVTDNGSGMPNRARM